MAGENCSSVCATQDHASFGECIKSKGVRAIGYRESVGRTSEAARAPEKELELYASAVRQGIEPNSTKYQDIQDALILSDHTESRFGVDFLQAAPIGDM